MNFALIQMSFSVNVVSVVNKSDIAFTTYIDESAVYFLWLFTSLSLRGTISDIVTAFASDFSDSARSMTDLDI